MVVSTPYPGVFTQEFGRTPNIPNEGTTGMAFVGPAERGPSSSAGFITNMRQFTQLYGNYFDASELKEEVKGALDQTGGNGQVFISRVTPDDAVKASTQIDGYDGNGAITVDADNEGAWGNDIRIRTQKYAIKTTSLVNDSDSTIEVNELNDVERGDIIRIDDGTNSVDTVVHGIDIANKELDVVPVDTSGQTIASGAVVYTATRHEYSSQLDVDFTQGDGELTVQSNRGAKVGQRVLVTDGNNVNYFTITKISGNTIQYDSNDAVENADMSSGAQVISLEYGIDVFELDEFKENYQFLSNQSSNKQRYVEFILKGKSNDSIRIEITDDTTTPAEDNIPIGPKPKLVNGNAIRSKVSLSGGDDGTLSSLDYIGTETSGTGVHAFDDISEVSLLAVPGVSSVNDVRAINTYVENRGDILYVADPPQNKTTSLEMKDYRENTLNLNSSYTAMCWPYLEIPDPENRQNTIDAPPSGFVLGKISNTNARRGVHVSPANEGGFNNVVGTALEDRITGGDHGLLNDVGVNVIKEISGGGTRLMGGRTLWNQRDGREYINIRNTLNFVKTSLSTGLRFALFEPNKESLWDQIEGTVNRFLGSMWQNGMLVPEDNPDKAFFVKVDEENNPQEEREKGKLHVDVGIRPPTPAEFIVLTVGLLGGAVDSILENVA